MTSSHPDIELLSSLVDGLDEQDVAAHVEGCDACRRTVAGLREVSAAVGAPVPGPASEDIEQAVLAALAAAPPPEAEITAIRARPRRLPRWTLAVAAAILVVAAAVPLIGRLSRQVGSNTAAKSTAAAGAGETNSLAQPTAGTPASSGADTSPGRTELGAVDDTQTLRARVRAVLTSSASPSAAPAPGTSGAASAASGQQVSDAASASPTTTAPTEPCLPAAVTAASVSAAAPTLSADVLWQGTPALLYAFARPDGTSILTVVAPSTCQVLVTVNL